MQSVDSKMKEVYNIAKYVAYGAACVLLFQCMLCSLTLADVMPPKSHLLERCVQITNSQAFDDIAILAVVGVYGNPTIYEVVQGKCLNKTYKFFRTDLYWIKKNALAKLGGIQGVQFKTVSWRSGAALFEKRVPIGLNVVFSGVNTAGSVFVSNEYSPIAESVECTLYRPKEDGNKETVSLYVSRLILEYSDSKKRRILDYQNRPDVQQDLEIKYLKGNGA